MDAPPIQYVKTRDGFSIAYCDVGQGTPLIWMPMVWTDQRYLWQGALAPIFHLLAQEYRVITFDVRGQGLSSRGLAASHALVDYELDVDALVEGLGLESFVLSAFYWHNLVAMHYAKKHSDRVAGLVLRNINRRFVAGGHWGQLAEADWELLLYHQAQAWFRNRPLAEMTALMRGWYQRDDYLAVVRAVVGNPLVAVLPPAIPTLLLVDNEAPEGWTRDAVELASAIPGSRLLLLKARDMLWSGDRHDSLPAGVKALREFMHGVAAPFHTAHESEVQFETLTTREREVLGLIVAGRTNREISGDLVLSERTVARHITNIYAKIGAHSKAEATAFAIHNKLV